MKKLKKELISVIIPCYNTGAFILDTLDSISKQTYQEYEIIIVDDGSTDNTQELVNLFIVRNPQLNIHYFYKKNGGVSSARNYGIENCNGDYIVFVDSDDLVKSNMLNELYTNLTNNNSDLAISNGSVFKNGIEQEYSFHINSLTIDKEHLITSIFSSKLANDMYSFNYNFCRSACCKLFKKSIINDNNIIFDNKFYLFEDGYFNLNYLKYTNTISYTKESLYIYKIEQGNSTRFRKNLIEENEYKINELKKYITSFNNQNIKNAFDIYNIDLFFAFVKKYLNNKNLKISKSEKIKLLKKEFSTKYEQSFNKSIYSYLNNKKKILYLLIKLKLFKIILMIVKKGR